MDYDAQPDVQTEPCWTVGADFARPVPGQDLFALALAQRGVPGPLVVERQGVGLFQTSLGWWLRESGTPDPVDFAALDLVQAGPVLDIGCATGRHIEALMAAGLDVEGIDFNPEAVKLARAYDCPVTQADIWSFTPDRQYRWLLALGNNIGIAGQLGLLPDLLDRFAALLQPGGEVLLSSVTAADDGPSTGGYPGDTRLRLRFAGQVGEWFDWLYVDPVTLSDYAADAGFSVRLMQDYGDIYVCVLRLDRHG